MEAAAAAKASRASRLARSLAAAAPCYSGVFVFFAALVVGALVSACWMSVSARVTPITPVATRSIAHNAATGQVPAPGPPRFTGVVGGSTNQTPSAAASSAPPPREVPVPAPASPAPAPAEAAAPPDCPSYFRWIHEDLRPWRAAGVSRDAAEGARRLFAPKFRVTVVAGRLYVARYGRCFQTRAAFTQWGILQLLRRYPGRVPDLDLMFDCEDLPVVSAGDRHQLAQAPPPPLFRYCGSETTLDIAFPDWSFWGGGAVSVRFWLHDTSFCFVCCHLASGGREGNEAHRNADATEILARTTFPRGHALNLPMPHKILDHEPELNIKPWEALRREINEGNAMVNWTDRAPYAYWKGNPMVGAERLLLLRCNASGKRDWNARVYAQDWGKEVRHGFRGSDLSKQCTHRYRIYIEGRGWSVSEKYILACDSVALMVRPRFHDFFSRGLSPMRHYWPVRGDRGMCRSIKYAVDWGNAHTDRAQEMAGNASRFIQEELTMDRVYDYMFHLLTEYARLLRYRPAVPRGAAEVTVESMTRGRRGLERQFMMDTVVASANGEGPCRLQPAYDAEELEALRRARKDVVRQVEAWESDG